MLPISIVTSIDRQNYIFSLLEITQSHDFIQNSN
jgi:hypothetical protein